MHELKKVLPPETFALAPSRLLRIPIHAAFAIVAIVAIAKGWLPWPLVPVASIFIGANFACLTFIAHEALHGAMTKNKLLQQIAGWLGFFPFMVSPKLWTVWHNRDHHAHTQMPDDPDGYATLDRYLSRASTRFSVDLFALGGGRWRGGLSLILGFSVQSTDQLFSSPALSPKERRRAFIESGVMLAAWAAIAIAVGAVPFLFIWLLPLLVANACVMMFIVTNHHLSPRVELDDPLISTLSVTTPRVIDWITFGFGYHVEHHVFPAISTRHAPKVRDALVAKWPERYQTMPLFTALLLLHRTARVYKHPTLLMDPKTKREFPALINPALLPGPVEAA